jgi:hypothetical protein
LAARQERKAKFLGERPDVTSGDTWAKASLLADFVDELIPGDDTWPSASTVGAQGVLAARLLDLTGEAGVDTLTAALLACGGPFRSKSEEQRVAVVIRLELEYTSLFALVRDAVFLAYYENPTVIGKIRALGYSYLARPHSLGYVMPPFDPAADAPRHHRGGFVATNAVRRVDVAAVPPFDAQDCGESSHGQP